MDGTRQNGMVVFFVLVIAIGPVVSKPLAAQVITDGSTGAQVTLNDLDVTIEDSLGTLSGSNLFHSFETFNINSGGSATFTGDASIQNVISRVTGGEVSNIQGALRSEVGNADFYFINPAGVTFGEGGSVDVPASFHVSTNDQLRFTDGSVLDTASPTTSTLSIATPEAFGYLGDSSGVIELVDSQIEITNGDIGITGNELVVRDGSLLSGFEGINIELSGNTVIENGGNITAVAVDGSDGGNIYLNANELLIDGQGSRFTTGIFSNVSTGAGSGGDIVVSVAENALLLDGGLINNLTTAEGEAGDIELTANDVHILGGGLISNATFAEGDAGDIRLTANNLLIDGQGVSDTTTGIINGNIGSSTGNAGDIDISIAELVTLQNRGRILNRTFSEGNAGGVQLDAGQLVIDGLDGTDETPASTITGIASSSEFGATGDSGDMIIFVDETTTIRNGGVISTSTFAEGNAGDIQLIADQLFVDSGSGVLLTGVTSSAEPVSTGGAGSIDIVITGLVLIQNSGVISTSTFSPGEAGILRLNANQLEIDGPGSAISSGSFISSGNGSDVIVVVTDLVSVTNEAQISSSSFAGGDAGSVLLTANEVLISDESIISSSTLSSTLDDITGNAGVVEVIFREQLTLQNAGSIATLSNSVGNAGSVIINSTTGSIQMLQNASIVSAAVEGSSDAGDITISTDGSIKIVEDSFVATMSAGGMAGPISIRSSALQTRNANLNTTTSSLVADGGNVSIDTEVFILEDTIIQANAVSGSGGTITIDSDAVIPFGNQLATQSIGQLVAVDAAGNVIQAVAENGVSIPPSINAPDTDISAALAELSADPGDAPTVASNPCAGFTDGSPSSLVESGRGGLPVTSATLTGLPTNVVQDTSAGQRLPLALNDTGDQVNAQAGCRSR